MLSIKNLQVSVEDKPILHGLDLQVDNTFGWLAYFIWGRRHAAMIA